MHHTLIASRAKVGGHLCRFQRAPAIMAPTNNRWRSPPSLSHRHGTRRTPRTAGDSRFSIEFISRAPSYALIGQRWRRQVVRKLSLGHHHANDVSACASPCRSTEPEPTWPPATARRTPASRPAASTRVGVSAHAPNSAHASIPLSGPARRGAHSSSAATRRLLPWRSFCCFDILTRPFTKSGRASASCFFYPRAKRTRPFGVDGQAFG